MKGDAGGGVWGKERKMMLCSLGLVQACADTVFHFCMRTAIVLGSGYVAFLLYIGMSYTDSWFEKLRLLPLLIVAVTIPLLGALLVRNKHLMELKS